MRSFVTAALRNEYVSLLILPMSHKHADIAPTLGRTDRLEKGKEGEKRRGVKGAGHVRG